jgi:cytochrome c oxidase subunit 3
MSTATAINIEQRERQAKKLASSIAMLVILVSLSMLFATLLLGYSAYRLTSPVWPPMGMDKVSLYYPTISSIIILVSSLTFMFFEKGFKEQNKNAIYWLLGTIVLGIAFMVAQFLLWGSMKNDGYYVETGIFASLIYGLTWIHAAHIIAGILFLAAMIPYALKLNLEHENKVENAGKFWHFLGIVWALMYLAVFVF